MSTKIKNRPTRKRRILRPLARPSILTIAQEIGITIVPSRDEGWWHSATINGPTIRAFSCREEALEDLWEMTQVRNHILKRWPNIGGEVVRRAQTTDQTKGQKP